MKKRRDTLKFECPYCHDINRTGVIDVHYKKGNGTVVRRRQCSKCSQRYSTVEYVIIGRSSKEDDVRKTFACIEKALAEADTRLRLLKRNIV